METKAVAEKALAQARLAGAEKTMVTVSSTVSKEFNIEANRLTLLRTNFDQSLNFKTLIDGRQATLGGNQFSGEAIADGARNAIAATLGAPQDESNGFAPFQGVKDFSFGAMSANEDWMYSCLEETLKDRERNFPKIIIEASTITFVRTEKVLATSEGTLLSSDQGSYQGMVMFTAKDKGKSSSFNYASFNAKAEEGQGPYASLLKRSHLEELLKQSSEQLNVRKIPEKFEGDVIITPHCMGDFVDYWCDFLGSGRMLKGSTFLKDKAGERVASSGLTLMAQPVDSAFASRKFWTSDGYLAENETIFERGVLKKYLLNHYAGKKLGLPISASEGSYLRIPPGETPLQDMVRSVKKGVLMCRYSAGHPSENGDVSGVAKNSFYIENGEILFPLGETMLAGNLSQMLSGMKNISRETVSTGGWEMPWIHFGGVQVS